MEPRKTSDKMLVFVKCEILSSANFFTMEATINFVEKRLAIKKTSGLKPGKGYQLTDILWWTQQDEVFAEMARMLHILSATMRTPGWFVLLMKVSKNIINLMTEEESLALENTGKRMQREGFPPHI